MGSENTTIAVISLPNTQTEDGDVERRQRHSDLGNRLQTLQKNQTWSVSDFEERRKSRLAGDVETMVVVGKRERKFSARVLYTSHHNALGHTRPIITIFVPGLVFSHPR